MNGSDARFQKQFESLTGFSPMGWQCRLFQRFVTGDLPEGCDIPTGLGKTSVLVIWLLAVVRQAELDGVRLPRRLIYIVNRRTVVDQATEVVDRMRRRLLDPDGAEWEVHSETLRSIASALQDLCAAAGPPLAVSTLRGELADNEEWKADPSRPAIVVGTIDMIGSKLLFSGYGDGRYGRAHHAGLVGQDSLIVHDEAHLTPAFSDLLRCVAEEQRRENPRNVEESAIVRPVRILELSATSRPGSGAPFTIEPEDEAEQVVCDRLGAAKRLRLHRADHDKLVAEMVALASEHKEARAKILIYVRAPEKAREVASALARSLGAGGEERVGLLTGTIRGHERDRLAATSPVYRLLLDPQQQAEQTVYLVSTSAGEVGIDLDADHLVCDLTTLDSLIQRLGRVNRRGGEDRQARIDVVGAPLSKDKPSALDRAIVATRALLELWGAESETGIDVGPGKLRQLVGEADPDAVVAAFSPVRAAPPLTDILLDAWSLTSIKAMPGRPDVQPFLHGVTRDPPETLVAWRQELRCLTAAGVDEDALRNWFRACRIETRERLRDRTDRVKGALDELLKSHRKKDREADYRVALLDARGEARWSTLSEVAGKDFDLAYRTVVLPVEAGGLDRNGMLDPAAIAPEGNDLDVSEVTTADDRREKWLYYRTTAGEHYERLLSGEIGRPPSSLREKVRLPLREPDEGAEDTDSVDLVLRVSSRRSALENPETASARQSLAVHTDAITERMTAVADRLDLPAHVRSALITAARWHDRGKDRPVWQRYARNEGGLEILAKAPRYLHPRALGGYRHEFGSLLEAMADSDLEQSPERDLVLHLVAAHHGWARPHFEPRSYDSTCTSAANDAAACEAMQRFGRLQQRFGRWGLAWLESLLRCADIAASQQAVGSPAIEFQEVAG